VRYSGDGGCYPPCLDENCTDPDLVCVEGVVCLPDGGGVNKPTEMDMDPEVTGGDVSGVDAGSGDGGATSTTNATGGCSVVADDPPFASFLLAFAFLALRRRRFDS
jgi:MYXO-CTERM domain-containing protein